VIQIALSLLLAVLLLGLMLHWALQADIPSKDLSAAWDTLGCLRTRFFPASLVDRILDDSDFLFVNSQKDRQILVLLEAERKAIVMYWLRNTRRQVKLLMIFHVKSARHYAKLAPRLEMRLASDYVSFLVVCDLLRILVRMRGPFRARKFARRTVAAGSRFCAASEQILMITKDPHAEIQEAPRNA